MDIITSPYAFEHDNEVKTLNSLRDIAIIIFKYPLSLPFSINTWTMDSFDVVP